MAQSFSGGPAVYFPAKPFLAASFLLISLGVCAQEVNRPNDSDLLTRLSYSNSGVVQSTEVRHVCVAVTRDGDYRIVRTDYLGSTQRLHGKMPKEQLQRLTELLGAAEFRSLSGYHGGLIRQEAESFSAEIPGPMRARADGTPQNPMERDVWRLDWLNADGESPFPGSLAKVVSWLRDFQPKGEKSFSRAEFQDVCPSRGFRLLQPTVAENEHP
jgi:hypothetical protein